MKNNISQIGIPCGFLCAALVVVALTLGGCKQETKVLEGAVTDVDRNVYDAAKIGKYTWMLQDLKTVHFAERTLMYCDYSYGKDFDWKINASIKHPNYPAYNKGVIRYMRNTKTPDLGPCPEGWHVPSVAEWEDLFKAVGRRSDWVDKSYSINGALVKDPESAAHCEFLNASGFGATLDRSSFVLQSFFADLTPEGHANNYKCYWTLDEGDLTEDGRNNCTYVKLSHPSMEDPTGNPMPEIKHLTASEEDGQPLYFVRCVKDLKPRETSWQVYE